MSNNKLSPLSVVERYHKRYLEYEAAFNSDPFDENQVQEKLKEVINSGVSFDSEEFENTVVDLMIEKPTKRVDVNNAALRFYLYAEFYLLTENTELPESIKKDFDNLPIAQDMKSFYSIKNGNFVRNEDVPIKVEREKLKQLYQALKSQ